MCVYLFVSTAATNRPNYICPRNKERKIGSSASVSFSKKRETEDYICTQHSSLFRFSPSPATPSQHLLLLFHLMLSPLDPDPSLHLLGEQETTALAFPFPWNFPSKKRGTIVRRSSLCLHSHRCFPVLVVLLIMFPPLLLQSVSHISTHLTRTPLSSWPAHTPLSS